MRTMGQHCRFWRWLLWKWLSTVHQLENVSQFVYLCWFCHSKLLPVHHVVILKYSKTWKLRLEYKGILWWKDMMGNRVFDRYLYFFSMIFIFYFFFKYLFWQKENNISFYWLMHSNAHLLRRAQSYLKIS